MAEKIITLSGAAADVLYALFFRGALLSGDLPSKSGAAVLRELGFAETRHTATEYQKENYFTFLTPEGQAFAVEHLVNTRFGAKVDGKDISSSITIGLELDMSNAQKAFDALEKNIRSSEVFKALKGEVFLADAFIKNSIECAKISSPPTLSSLAKKDGGPANDGFIKATLSEVLSRVLPMTPEHKAKDVAINAAGAIYAAFASLDEDNASPR